MDREGEPHLGSPGEAIFTRKREPRSSLAEGASGRASWALMSRHRLHQALAYDLARVSHDAGNELSASRDVVDEPHHHAR